jgi:hypothetical protein
MAVSHVGHDHPATPAGRRACRSGNAPAPVPATDDYISAHMNNVLQKAKLKAEMDRNYDQIKMTGPVARRMAKHSAKADALRIQPRRSGARVSTIASTCVQAALHIDAHGGKCACGWEAEAA